MIQKMNFEKHLRSDSREASQEIGILRKSWQSFHDGLLLRRCFRGLSCPFFSTVLQFGSRPPKKTLHCVAVSGASFLTGVVFECDLALCRPVAVLCMLYKIRCNSMYPLCGALPVPYVLVRVTLGTVISHRYTYAAPRCRTSQYHRTFIQLSVTLERSW